MASEKTEAVKRCSAEKVCLKILQNLQENTYCARVPQACNFIKKETLAQVFSGEFCDIRKNTFPYRTPPVAVLVDCKEINLSLNQETPVY